MIEGEGIENGVIYAKSGETGNYVCNRWLSEVVIFDLRDGGKRDLDNLPVRDLNLDAGCREGLGCLHALDFPAHAPAIRRDDLHVIFSVKWLQCRKRLGYLHSDVLQRVILPVASPEVYRVQPQTGIWRIETCPCILR